MTRYLKHARLLAGSLAVIVGLTLAAPPAQAAGPAPGPIAAAAAAKVEAAPVEALAQAAPAAPAAVPAPTGEKPFFKTTTGVISLVLLAGAVGYMGYSMSNDRVKSPAK